MVRVLNFVQKRGIKMLKELIKEILKEELSGKKEVVEQCSFIGKKVMIRTYSAGVHFGTLASKNGKEVMLKDAHRVYSWVNACSLSQLAVQGSKNKNTDNKISIAVSEIVLTEAIEIIPMTDESFGNLTASLWMK
ncbi:MAG: Iodobacter phage PhiPLPE [Pseudomonadota bacterium]|jgi:ferredoxin-fold anticodon binding domain-containing protein